MQAMRPTPSDTINQAVINRQYYAQTQRGSLYNPISPYAEDYDPLRPYSRQKQGTSGLPDLSGSLRTRRIMMALDQRSTTTGPRSTSPV